MPTSAVLTRFLAVQAELNQVLVERSGAVENALLALLTGEHYLQLGQPGIGKTLLVDELLARITGARLFKILLNPSTVPDEVLGPVDLLQLSDHGRYTRIRTGSITEAEIVYLDETWKCNSVVLNGLLKIMNERKLDEIGMPTVQLPLISLFGSSNETPQDDSLRALDDRFVLREIVAPVQEDGAFVQMLTAPCLIPTAFLSLADIQEGQQAVRALKGTQEVLQAIVTLRHVLSEQGVYVSPRRWKKALGLIKAKTWLGDQTEMSIEDMTVLAHSLWTDPKERAAVQRAVFQIACPLSLRALEIEDQAEDILKQMPKEGADDFNAAAENALQAISDMHNLLHGEIERSHARDTVLALSSLAKIKAHHKRLAGILWKDVARFALAGK